MFMCMCVGFPGVLVVKNPSAKEADIRDEGLILIKGLGCEDPLGEGMTTHSSMLAWRIPWTEEPGGLQSMRIAELDMTATSMHTHTHAHTHTHTHTHAYVCVCVLF